MKAPIFIFSLPRSGSTLLQRILMTHKDIASVAEPWILLPQMYMLRDQGVLSEYSSLTAYYGVKDFVNNLPNKEDDYIASLRDFVFDLYKKQCKNNEIYFLDKTPRYYLIIDEINKLFPDAKFIFLFRNPIHVFGSIISTWGNNRFNKYHGNYDDLTLGFELLSKGYQNYKSKSLAINYEQFIQNPDAELAKLSSYLDIEIDQSALQNFSKENTKGTLGDPTGVKKYTSISDEGLHKWKGIFNSIVRKRIAIGILNKIESQYFEIQGYKKQELKSDLKQLNNRKNHLFIIDLFDYWVSSIIRRFNLNILKSKSFSWVKRRFLS